MADANEMDLAYGGFMVTKRVLAGIPIGYTYREQMAHKELNGWIVYSVQDDDDYVADPANFQVVTASALLSAWPHSRALLEVFDAPYGTDLGWVYEQGVLTGFWDMSHNRAIGHEEILAGAAVPNEEQQ
jgi:hypothetical protein